MQTTDDSQVKSFLFFLQVINSDLDLLEKVYVLF